MHQARLPRVAGLFTLVSLSALGLVHCGTDDAPATPGMGGTGGGGKGGTAGGSAAGTAGTNSQSGSNHGGMPSGEGGAAGDMGTAGTDTGLGGMPGGGADGEGGAGGGESGGAGGDDGGGHHHAVLSSILIGKFTPLPAYDNETFAGQALLYRSLAGDTTVSIQLTGLTASTTYASHVHNQPCSVLAGGHYLRDPAGAAGESNEIWLPLTSNASGIGFTEVTVTGHAARGDALAIVVHDPAAAGAKMACADLELGSNAELTASGTFAPFAAAEAADASIAGTVDFVRNNTGTQVTLDVNGLGATSDYHCHIHALPCAVMSAGGHYKLDPTNATTAEANELWPNLGDTSDTLATGVSAFGHRARLDAQSIVIHRTSNATTPKVACADLAVEAYPDVEVAGDALLLPAATPDYADLDASAELLRTLEGTTTLHVEASGLMSGKTYPTHLHHLPCAIQNGGNHYLRDKEAAASEDNEIWLPLIPNASGDADATASFQHLAAADARSVVIHDPSSEPVNARLACIDLE